MSKILYLLQPHIILPVVAIVGVIYIIASRFKYKSKWDIVFTGFSVIAIIAYVKLIEFKSQKRDQLIYAQIVNSFNTTEECKSRIEQDWIRNAKWINDSQYYRFLDNVGIPEYPVSRMEYHLNYRIEEINWPDNGVFKPGICEGENCIKVTVSCNLYIDGGDVDVEAETFSNYPVVSK